jgi:hypothetical protein
MTNPTENAPWWNLLLEIVALPAVNAALPFVLPLFLAACNTSTGALSARLDAGSYRDATNQGRGEAALSSDASLCSRKTGEPQTGAPTSAKYRQCMASRGWRFAATLRAPEITAEESKRVDEEVQHDAERAAAAAAAMGH